MKRSIEAEPVECGTYEDSLSHPGSDESRSDSRHVKDNENDLRFFINKIKRFKSGISDDRNGNHSIEVEQDASKQSDSHTTGTGISQNRSEVEVKECTDCLRDPYLICVGLFEKLSSSFLLNPPPFIQELKTFMTTHRKHESIKIYCKNCSRGPMNDWTSLSSHLNGKSHVNKIKSGDLKCLKFFLCSTCFKVYSHCIESDDGQHKMLPENLSDIFNKMFPLANPKGGQHEESNSWATNIPKKSPHTIDVIFLGEYNFLHKIYIMLIKAINNACI